jgi:hypothetical protein
LPASVASRQQVRGMTGRPTTRLRPGVCFPWEEKARELPPVTGNRELVQKIWEDIDAFGVTYIWQMLESF